ncbi:MAG: RNA polymerase sigma factor [Verrucomicrobiota bacterium]
MASSTSTLDAAAASDESLVRQALDGSDDAFRALLALHLQPLRTYLALRAPLPQVIDEVAHDAFVFAYQHLEDFRSGSLQPWLRSIAHNLLRDRLKAYAREMAKQERYLDHLRLELAQSSTDSMDEHPRADQLRHCLGKLRHSQQEILDLRYGHELSSDEIARRTGRSTLAIRTLLMRLRQQLRQCIETQTTEALS